MKICTYDNPATMSRECWQDGKLLCAYKMQLFFAKGDIPSRLFFFGANIGPWVAGQMTGDGRAMSQNAQNRYHNE